ncbi:efflux transporter outer membrane subunit [Burkholderiaceae bacterium DAT-1]|nr:efflux transporter outer membrane subunit [Burkholderiaceae bacterium DAT-1]
MHLTLPHRAIPLLIGTMLTGCATGPAFQAPDVAKGVSDRYVSGNAVSKTHDATTHDNRQAGVAQQVDYGQSLPAQWWTLFQSPELDQMIRTALKNNPGLQAAQHTLEAAQDNLRATTGSLSYPQVNGQLGAQRQRGQMAGATPSVYNLYNAGVNVSYSIDLFGANKHQLESLAATVDYQRFQHLAASNMLVSNVVTTAIREATLRDQLQAAKTALDAGRNVLQIQEKQLQLGAIPLTAVLNQRNAVNQLEAQIAPLEKSAGQSRHALNTLLGLPASDTSVPAITLANVKLPERLPVALPSALARQRPDIQASEALLHQASANLGLATANLYPQLNLTGSFSYSRVETGAGGAGSTLWNIGAGLTQPLFNGGALRARKDAAQANYDAAEAQYRSVVLSAFQNVADNLRALESDADVLKAQADNAAQTRQTRDIVRKQHAAGAVSLTSVLSAEQAYAQSQLNLANAQGARYADTAALFASLGGGWWDTAGATGNGAKHQ